MNIVLTGFMATGKTEISKAISEISKYNLVDTDDMIVEQEGITINEIFDKCGEEYFRKTECEVIKKAAEMKNVVIATGGGRFHAGCTQSVRPVYCVLSWAGSYLRQST